MLAGRQALPLPLPLPLTAFPKVDYKLKALVIAALSQQPAASTGVACLLLNSPILGIPNDLLSALLASSFHLARRRPARSVVLWCEMEWPGGHCVVQLPVACGLFCGALDALATGRGWGGIISHASSLLSLTLRWLRPLHL
ncbi:hypothetical protein ACLKA6_002117 [Drosophila palustris]